MVSVSKVATQKNYEDGEIVFRARTETDVRNMTKFICKGDIVGKRNFIENDFNPDKLTDEMLCIQDLYGKKDGIRARGLILSVDKDDPDYNDFHDNISYIADQYCMYIASRGFQVLYHIKDEDKIEYLINSTSYQNGYKFRHDMEEEYNKANEILASVKNHNKVDNSGLEFYPYSF